MKIIGESGSVYNKQFIVTISERDLRDLVGLVTLPGGHTPALGVGDEVKVNAMFRKLQDLATQERAMKEVADRLDRMSATLRLDSILVKAVAEEIPSGK